MEVILGQARYLCKPLLDLTLGMSYEQKEMVLEADEITLFYSDGLVEAHNPYGEIFGFPRLQTLVAEFPTFPPFCN